MMIENTLLESLTTRTTQELIALKQDALHNAARYPIGSLRRRYYLGIVDRITSILRHQIKNNAPNLNLRL